MSRGYWPVKESDQVSFVVRLAEAIAAEAGHFGLSAEQSANLTAAAQAYRVEWQRTMEPETRTRPQTARKNAARDAVRKLVRLYSQIIYGQGLSAATLISLELTPPKRHRQPTPVPDAAPAVTVRGVVGHRVEIGFFNYDTLNPRKRPAGAIGAYVYVCVGDGERAADASAWTFLGTVTTRTHEIAFDRELPPGQRVWIRAAWVTRDGQTSPFSAPVMTYLQGGGIGDLTQHRAAA
jgi:hypothetical protein